MVIPRSELPEGSGDHRLRAVKQHSATVPDAEYASLNIHYRRRISSACLANVPSRGRADAMAAAFRTLVLNLKRFDTDFCRYRRFREHG